MPVGPIQINVAVINERRLVVQVVEGAIAVVFRLEERSTVMNLFAEVEHAVSMWKTVLSLSLVLLSILESDFRMESLLFWG